MSTRKTYTIEFKRQAVELMRRHDKPVTRIAQDLSISESALRRWHEQFPGGSSSASKEPEHDELLRLRKEVRVLQMERDILKKAAAFFAKESL